MESRLPFLFYFKCLNSNYLEPDSIMNLSASLGLTFSIFAIILDINKDREVYVEIFDVGLDATQSRE